MRTIKSRNLDSDDAFFRRVGQETPEIRSCVRNILDDVKSNGDDALFRYTKKFDGIELESVEVGRQRITDAYSAVDADLIRMLKRAKKNVERFAKMQARKYKGSEIEQDGIVMGEKIIPIGRVGCYVPGGRYPLVSTAIMCIVPAKVAGVGEVIVCSPRISPEVIVACDIAGADRIFNVGGAQAIGAMAFGTESVPRVDKIVGPGNKYVALAKKEVFGDVGIDFVAGPSEVLVIADETADAGLIAADMLAQAEHDPDARAGLLTTSEELASMVEREIEIRIKELSTREVAEKSIAKSLVVVCESVSEMIDIANKIASEHLEVQVRKPEDVIGALRNYGALFVGRDSAEVFGDYCSGPNHTLPTGGAARYTGGLSVGDFVKIVTYEKSDGVDSDMLRMIEMAEAFGSIEGLDGHRRAAIERK